MNDHACKEVIDNIQFVIQIPRSRDESLNKFSPGMFCRLVVNPGLNSIGHVAEMTVRRAKWRYNLFAEGGIP